MILEETREEKGFAGSQVPSRRVSTYGLSVAWLGCYYSRSPAVEPLMANTTVLLGFFAVAVALRERRPRPMPAIPLSAVVCLEVARPKPE